MKLRQASNRYKRVFGAAKFAYANNSKEAITSLKIGSRDFWRIANIFLNKGKSATTSPSNGPEVLSFALSFAFDKEKIFTKTFTQKSNLNDSGILLLAFPSGTNLKLHNIHATPKVVKKVITNLICQRRLVLIVFP